MRAAKTLLLTILLTCLASLASPAFAHGDYYTSDENHDGKITFYRAAHFHKHFGRGMRRLRQPHKHYARAPTFRRVYNKANAELLIRYSPPDNYFSKTYYCGNSTYKWIGAQDVMNLDPQCDSFWVPVMHEGARVFGMLDHPGDGPGHICLSLVSTGGCIYPHEWTNHDWNYFANWP